VLERMLVGSSACPSSRAAARWDVQRIGLHGALFRARSRSGSPLRTATSIGISHAHNSFHNSRAASGGLDRPRAQGQCMTPNLVGWPSSASATGLHSTVVTRLC
jgi:hypothetical protein